ncbi:FMN-dependent NADH-azoreductase [Plantactinospora sp. KBS50]|uniref:FMN-dependent NADH-azoreductase n=1 Tax=Plantactinospora sp. KBS50 TaxID=2024580 RepID=UPI001E6470EB|nr:NAD(P)H-dependent oxidoreductase [Plantactinospora sp. KBS50]
MFNTNHLRRINDASPAAPRFEHPGDRSTSRRLTARAAALWQARHPDGTVTYRDFGREPLPHLDADGGLARATAPEQHSPAQRASWDLSVALVEEVKRADTVLLGLPLYNFAAPSSVKAWVDHLIVPGVAYDPATGAGLLGDREFIVLASRGGGYGAGTPRVGWDHAEPWLPHGLAMTGLSPRFITAELTLAPVNPAMAELVPLAAQSLAAAERAIDDLWAPAVATGQGR